MVALQAKETGNFEVSLLRRSLTKKELPERWTGKKSCSCPRLGKEKRDLNSLLVRSVGLRLATAVYAGNSAYYWY